MVLNDFMNREEMIKQELETVLLLSNEGIDNWLEEKFRSFKSYIPFPCVSDIIYRVVNYKLEFKNLHQVKAPPKEEVTKWGRLNELGESIFYLTDNILTGLYEITEKNFKIGRYFSCTGV